MGEKRQDIRSLTGLRGVAAGMVVIGHFWAALRLTVVDSFWLWPFPPLGMAVFFMLSGYVIALSYGHWDWRQQPLFNLCRLMLYRVARLYPAFLLFALLILLRNPPLRDLDAPEPRAYVLDHLLLLQSWFPIRYDGGLASADRFHVSWSLSTEWALYILFGVGAVLTARWHRHWIAMAMIFFASLTALLTVMWTERAFFMPVGWSDLDWNTWLFHISPLGILMLFGLGVASHRASLALGEAAKAMLSNTGAIALVAFYLFLVLDQRGWIWSAIIVSLAVHMVGASSGSIANRLLSHPALVYVGMISYSLYLFHFLIAQLFQAGGFLRIDDWWVLNFAVAFAFAVMLATGIYRLVEVPGRRAIRNAADRLRGIGRLAPEDIAAIRPPPAS